MSIDPISWDEISQLYESLSEKDKEKREKYYLDKNVSLEVRSEIEALIDLETPSKEYFDQLSENVISPAILEMGDLPPSSGRVYNYKILKKIGRGGMGTVYLAERDDDVFKSQVAVKILRRGFKHEEIIAGFRAERQILAQLNHPSITHLLDGGMTTDGRPYFIMEYVDGKTITDYCNEHRLSIVERLEIFKQICDTLAYAHQNLVIHRDLKPANILVTNDGNVKLLDFGIAKFIDEKQPILKKTAVSKQRLLTPEYASPEQIQSGPMNTATDIYQLGLVLYKLICGKLPFSFHEKSFPDTERIILKEEPVAPSKKFSQSDPDERKKIAENCSTTVQALKAKLKNDLDSITLMALKKRPEDRYQSIMEFKEDIERYQNDLPVKSHGNRFEYRVSKYIKRNRVNIAIAVLFLTMLLSFAMIYNFSVTQQRNYAQQEAAKAAQVTSFLIDMFEANDPNQAQGNEFTARELLDRGKEQISLLSDIPEIQAELYQVTGQIYRRLGSFEEADELYQTALQIRNNLFESENQAILSIYNQQGLLYSDMGDYDRAETILRHALSIAENSSTIFDPVYAETISNLAYVLRRTGKYDEAEKMFQKSYEITSRNLGNEHPSTIENLSSIGVTLLNKGDYEGARQILQNVLDIRLKSLGSSHPDVAMSMNSLGALLLNIGRFDEAENLFRESLETRINLFGEMHPKVALTMNNLGIALREQGFLENSYSTMTRALEIRSEVLGSDNINTAISKFTLGNLLLEMGSANEANQLLTDAHRVFSNQLTENHSFTARTKMALGTSYWMLNKPEFAEQYINTGFSTVLEIHNRNSLETALAHWEYGSYLKNKKQFSDARVHLQTAHEILKEVETVRSRRSERLSNNLSEVEMQLQSAQNEPDF